MAVTDETRCQVAFSLDGNAAIRQAVVGRFFLIIEQLDQLMIRVVIIGQSPEPFRAVDALGPCCAQFGIAQAVVTGWQQTAARLLWLRDIGGVQQMPAVK